MEADVTVCFVYGLSGNNVNPYESITSFLPVVLHPPYTYPYPPHTLLTVCSKQQIAANSHHSMLMMGQQPGKIGTLTLFEICITKEILKAGFSST